jgi:hypothetical protein
MQKMLIVILFSTVALNAMERENNTENALANSETNGVISLLRKINNNLDEGFDHDNLKSATDEIIMNVDKIPLAKAWESDSAKLHAKTAHLILKVGLKEAVKEKIHYEISHAIFETKNYETTIERIDQIIANWRDGYNNTKRNVKYIEALEKNLKLDNSLNK